MMYKLLATSLVFTSLAAAAQPEFYKGADISLLQTIEDCGGVYKADGRARDPLLIFKNNGCNAMRIRLFHTPTGESPRVNSLDYTRKLGRRIKDAGLQLMLDIHYSDTWADPGNQQKPAAWEDLSFEELVKAVRDYTEEVIVKMCEAGADPDWVQVGNEIAPGMLWPDGRVGTPEQWKKLATLLKAGIDGVHAGRGDRSMRTIIHLHSGGSPQQTARYFDSMKKHNVNYDIIGLSYYPWWHSRGLGFEPLQENLKAITERFTNDIMVVETAYPWYPNCDDPTRLLHKKERRPLIPGLPASKEGQKEYLEQIIKVSREAPKGRCIGLFYWAPEYIPAPRLHPGRGHLSLFDQEGNVLPGMNAFRK
ncbi:MAG: antitoxin [Fuerstiella sp.]|nr:antitoxin [Fuerstiella sp.]MCP4854150.1 antitoxin [Fuerstiella sp.]